MLLLLDQTHTCSRFFFSMKMLLWDQQAVSWSGMFLWRYSIRRRHEFFCFSASKSKTGFVYLPNDWVISCGVLIGSASENSYVCAQPYTCGLLVACKLLSWAKESQSPDGGRIRAVLCVADSSVVAFARIMIMTQRGTSQLLLTHEGRALLWKFFQTLSLPHHCVLLLFLSFF